MSKLQSKGEVILDLYLKRRFNKRFIKVRPDFLRNPKTGRCLEYDFYNDSLKLAIEYNGKQHYEYVARYHNAYSDFEDQLYRDDVKKRLSKLRGITLIVVPYNFDYTFTFQYPRCERYIDEIYTEIQKTKMKNMTKDNIANICYFLEKQFELNGFNYHWYDRLKYKIKNMFHLQFQ